MTSLSLFKILRAPPISANFQDEPALAPQQRYFAVEIKKAGEGVEKREPSYTVGGNADWYSHYGKQCGDFLKNWK